MSDRELVPSGARRTRSGGAATGRHQATEVTAPLSVTDLTGSRPAEVGSGRPEVLGYRSTRHGFGAGGFGTAAPPAGQGRRRADDTGAHRAAGGAWVGNGPGAVEPGAYPDRRSLRTRRRMAELSRRPIPWWWIAGGLVALLLVGRGVVGADSGGSGSATTAAPAVTSTAAPSAPASTPADVVPTDNRSTPPQVPRVTLPQIVPSPSGNASAAPSASRTPAARPAACTVAVATASFFGGYVSGLTVTNSGGSTVHGWQLTFQLPSGQRLANAWNGRYSVSGTTVTVLDAGSSNATLAPGASTQLGFQVQAMYGGGPGGPGGQGSFPGPFGFVLNGITCGR